MGRMKQHIQSHPATAAWKAAPVALSSLDGWDGSNSRDCSEHPAHCSTETEKVSEWLLTKEPQCLKRGSSWDLSLNPWRDSQDILKDITVSISSSTFA